MLWMRAHHAPCAGGRGRERIRVSMGCQAASLSCSSPSTKVSPSTRWVMS